MKPIFRASLIYMGFLMIYLLFIYFPVIMGSFDEGKYVDSEVFTQTNGEYDFRKFSLKSSHTKNYTALIDTSGFAQFLDDRQKNTINVFEWDKMTSARRERFNLSMGAEFKKPSHVVEGIRIYECDFFSKPLYSAYVCDDDRNIAFYIASPTQSEIIEMVKTLKIK